MGDVTQHNCNQKNPRVSQRLAMGSLRWHLRSPVTRLEPAGAKAMGTGMEEAKAVGKNGQALAKGSGNNSGTRKCGKGRQITLTSSRLMCLLLPRGWALPAPPPPQQPDERRSQIQACHQEACGGWTDIEGEQQSLPLTQSWLSDPGSLSIHL